MTDQLEHSPLGGSGAERWMECPGSVRLSHGIEDEESEYSLPGTQAHLLAEHCLKTGADAWEFVREDTVVDKGMADAVQVYLNFLRHEYDFAVGEYWVEHKFHCPEIHELMWGKIDFAEAHDRQLEVTDYKHGAGIVVEVQRNPQLMYYGVGMLTSLDLWKQVDVVKLRVIQPRGFHFDGPIREWTVTSWELAQWRDEVLVPAMDRALVSNETASGEHCRFCPARSHACPQILKDFAEMEELMIEFSKKDTADQLTDEQLGRMLALHDLGKIASKAANTTAFNRMMAGGKVPGRKLVKSRTNREWKEDAEPELVKKFGDEAWAPAKLRSPAQLEELPEGGKYTARYAFKPDGGQTIAADKDTRPAVAGGVTHLFKDQTKKEETK